MRVKGENGSGESIMCDFGTAAASMLFSGPKDLGDAMPWLDKPTKYTSGELLGQLSGVAGAAGEAYSAYDIGRQQERRASQILAATKQSIELKAAQQGRYRGAQAAAIGRSGVRLTGSAKDLIEQQGKYDEIVLESMKQRGVIEIQAELRGAEASKTKMLGAVGRAIAKGAEFGENAYNTYEGFGLG